ncbi:L-ascorbate oxidase [Folsomia candida]|uniref:L-ascorbate oxidase n=1 Tax=Folsomia candida TaxID=158441 RepID=A0A226EIT6_FOLCA|nr:L-ascorbate oxidase [Folsomia candida]
MRVTIQWTVAAVLSIVSIFPIIQSTIQSYADFPERHPCYRECSSDPLKSMTCGYNFTLEYFWVLSKACYECPNITSDCSRFDCIPADGVKRAIAVVNRMMPGPAIRVCQGDTVVVDVKNNLYGEGTAIHWHGIHQKKTPWMDGVPGTTQCPIPAGGIFRYEFEVPLGGSYFWHSHAGFQRGDGIFGSLVVRQPKKNNSLYDFDLPEHELLIWDWLADLSLPVFLSHHHADGDNKPRGVLINGRGFPPGFFKDFGDHETIKTKGKPYVPLYEVRVDQGSSYRVRLISNGVLNCPLAVSIENHTMTVISSDGFDIVVYAGERWDIVIRADQPIGTYWIKFQGLMDCDDRFTSAYQLAVLNYNPVPIGTVPSHNIRNWHEAAPEKYGLQLNPLNTAPGVEGQYITAAELNSAQDDDPEILTKEKADHQFYLSYDFNPIDNLRFHGPHIPIRTVRKGFKLYTPQLNYISHVMPAVPILTQPESMSEMQFCNDKSMKVNCTAEYCECVHLLKVELNSIVEFVMVDRGYTFDANHPFHLHGHAFRVVAMERLNKSTEPHFIKNRDEAGLIPRQTLKAVIKDTVTVPDGGYTIFRFRADNPGFWFYHCHITFHVEVGMGLILQVGNVSEMLSAPKDFPKCGNYLPEVSNPPVYYQENTHSISLENGSNPHHPSYDIMTTTDSSLPSKHSSKPKPSKGKSSASFNLPNFLALVIIMVNFITFMT